MTEAETPAAAECSCCILGVTAERGAQRPVNSWFSSISMHMRFLKYGMSRAENPRSRSAEAHSIYKHVNTPQSSEFVWKGISW